MSLGPLAVPFGPDAAIDSDLAREAELVL